MSPLTKLPQDPIPNEKPMEEEIRVKEENERRLNCIRCGGDHSVMNCIRPRSPKEPPAPK